MKTKNHYKSEYEERFSYEIIEKIIKPKLAHHFNYEEEVCYFSVDGKKRCIHPDFIIHGKTEQIKVVIEIDGKQHQKKDAIVNDAMRDSTLRESGYRVIRLSTKDIDEHMSGCVLRIIKVLESEEIHMIEAAQGRKLYQFRQMRDS